MATRTKAPRAAPNPRSFFEVSCPRVLQIMRATCADLGGAYCIDVEGAGAWTLDFPSTSVKAGRAPDAAVTVHLSPAQFASLSTGKVELAKLVADGAARCEGDRARLENVSLVLAFLERG